MRCPRGGDIRTFLTDLRYKRKELAAAGVYITDNGFRRTSLQGIPDGLAQFAVQVLSSARMAHPGPQGRRYRSLDQKYLRKG